MTLSISMWNIQGLNSSAFGLKSLNTEFQKSIKEMDIIILQETWSRADAITHCPPNYREIILPSQKLSTVRQGRDSGGQIIWYKSKLHNHINTVKQGKCYTWLKIHKELLSSRKDIFLCAIYIPPSESPLLQRRYVLHIRGRDESLPGPGKRAHLRGPERKNRTTAGLHRHTR